LINKGKIAEAKAAAENIIGPISYVLRGADLPKVGETEDQSATLERLEISEGIAALDEVNAEVEQTTILTK